MTQLQNHEYGFSTTACGRETGDYKTLIQTLYLGKYGVSIN